MKITFVKTVAVLPLLLLNGCAREAWTHKVIVDPITIRGDFYECEAEAYVKVPKPVKQEVLVNVYNEPKTWLNSVLEREEPVDDDYKHARSSVFKACMYGKGYYLERLEDSEE